MAPITSSACAMSRPVRPGVLEPGLAELARVLDRLLLPGAVVGALADAVALRAPGVVALGVAPAGAAVAGVDGDERGHRASPPDPAQALHSARARLLYWCGHRREPVRIAVQSNAVGRSGDAASRGVGTWAHGLPSCRISCRAASVRAAVLARRPAADGFHREVGRVCPSAAGRSAAAPCGPDAASTPAAPVGSDPGRRPTAIPEASSYVMGPVTGSPRTSRRAAGKCVPRRAGPRRSGNPPSPAAPIARGRGRRHRPRTGTRRAATPGKAGR